MRQKEEEEEERERSRRRTEKQQQQQHEKTDQIQQLVEGDSKLDGDGAAGVGHWSRLGAVVVEQLQEQSVLRSHRRRATHCRTV